MSTTPFDKRAMAKGILILDGSMDITVEKQRRKQLASLPFSEKIKILEKLGRVSDAAGESGLRKEKPVSEAR